MNFLEHSRRKPHPPLVLNGFRSATPGWKLQCTRVLFTVSLILDHLDTANETSLEPRRVYLETMCKTLPTKLTNTPDRSRHTSKYPECPLDQTANVSTKARLKILIPDSLHESKVGSMSPCSYSNEENGSERPLLTGKIIKLRSKSSCNIVYTGMLERVVLLLTRLGVLAYTRASSSWTNHDTLRKNNT